MKSSRSGDRRSTTTSAPSPSLAQGRSDPSQKPGLARTSRRNHRTVTGSGSDTTRRTFALAKHGKSHGHEAGGGTARLASASLIVHGSTLRVVLHHPRRYIQRDCGSVKLVHDMLQVGNGPSSRRGVLHSLGLLQLPGQELGCLPHSFGRTENPAAAATIAEFAGGAQADETDTTPGQRTSRSTTKGATTREFPRRFRIYHDQEAITDHQTRASDNRVIRASRDRGSDHRTRRRRYRGTVARRPSCTTERQNPGLSC